MYLPLFPIPRIATVNRHRSRPRFVCFAALTIAISAAWPTEVSASASAFSEIKVSDLTLSPSSGTFSLLGDWNASSFSEALNSLGASDNDFASQDNGSVLTSASVTWAIASGTAETIGLTAEAEALAEIPAGILQAGSSATGLGTLSTSFQIVDLGSGSVDVEVSLELFTSLWVNTDFQGLLAESEAILSLEIGGQSVLLHHDLLSIGPSGSDSTGFAGPLSESISLELNTPYLLVLSLDSEARALTVPESGALPLGLALGVMSLVRWRLRSRSAAELNKGGGVP